MSQKLRRANIVELLKQIILENTDLTVAQLLTTIMRTKNFKSTKPYDASDITMASVLESTLTELKEEQNELQERV